MEWPNILGTHLHEYTSFMTVHHFHQSRKQMSGCGGERGYVVCCVGELQVRHWHP
jgi:hypothetical protein